MNEKKNAIFLILAAFFLSKLILIYYQKIVWWDSAVYIGMGKSIYSFGHSGLWEPSRPLILPIILGFSWKLNFPILFFRILDLFFATGCVYLVYLIARKIFNDKIALISSVFLAFSPTYYFFSGQILSEIPSLFFALLSIYFFFNTKFLISGLFSGISFMTRFLQIFIFVVLLALSTYKNRKIVCKDNIKIICGFLVIVAPFLILNQLLYKNIIYPFALQTFITENTGYIYHQPFAYYFIKLLMENLSLILLPFGLFFIFKSANSKNVNDFGKIVITHIFLIFFILFNLIKHKEMRLLIISFPYMYLIASYFLVCIEEVVKKYYKFNILLVVIPIFLISANSILISEKNEIDYKNQYDFFQNYLEDNQIEDIIWASNPIVSLYTENKINELIYYPVFNDEQFVKMVNKENINATILFDTCDIYCEPKFPNCDTLKKELVVFFNKTFTFKKENRFDDCYQYIFNNYSSPINS